MTLATTIAEAHEAGFEANYDGVLLRDNPHLAGSDEARAWESGHLQAGQTRREWEQSNDRAAAYNPEFLGAQPPRAGEDY